MHIKYTFSCKDTIYTTEARHLMRIIAAGKMLKSLTYLTNLTYTSLMISSMLSSSKALKDRIESADCSTNN